MRASADQDRAAILTTLRGHSLRQLPLVDPGGRVVGLIAAADFLDIPVRENPVVIMAGGKGERLADLTRDPPKPMLKVGPRPILDTIVSNLAGRGFGASGWRNYRDEQIEAHFGAGSALGLDIRYLRETKPPRHVWRAQPVATAGSARGGHQWDVLARADYSYVLDSHLQSNAAASVVGSKLQDAGAVRRGAGRWRRDGADRGKADTDLHDQRRSLCAFIRSVEVGAVRHVL